MSKPECKCTVCHNANNASNKFCIFCGDKMLPCKEQSYKKESSHSKEYQNVLGSTDGILVALLAKVAKADGKISQDEAQYIGEVYDSICQNNGYPNLRDILKKILTNEKENLNNVGELCDILLKLKVTKKYKLALVSTLVELAYIDGNYTHSEQNLTVKIVHHLNIDYVEYTKIVECFSPKKEQEENKSGSSYSAYLTIDECFDVLKTSKDADNATLKKNYIGMVKQYHSDKLKGKDLPDDLIAFAEEKLKALNFAYEKLKKYKDS